MTRSCLCLDTTHRQSDYILQHPATKPKQQPPQTDPHHVIGQAEQKYLQLLSELRQKYAKKRQVILKFH